jgi:exopolysaccharide biosynthesis polyprenyl glycosylphosphotransferase
MNPRIHRLKYILIDFLFASAAWTLFFVFRKIYIEPQKFGYPIPVEFDKKYFLGLIFIPLFWLLLYYISGYYKDIYRKSRLNELGQTLFITLIGVVVIFFALILDDTVLVYKNYYVSFLALFTLHFTLTYIPRFFLTTNTIHRVHRGKIGFNTLLIGGNKQAYDIFHEIQAQDKSIGNKFIGFVNVREEGDYMLSDYLPHLGSLENLREVIVMHAVEEVIIALESSEHEEIERIINKLYDLNIVVKVIPSMYDILTGKVKMSIIFGTPLIQITHELMPAWQEKIKKLIDIVVSLIALILLSPFALFLAIGIKLTSKGPVFYSHERIGKYGKPFKIFKFRSMYQDAEAKGPTLSSKNDPRITPFGRFMRKSKLDEIPNFYNVLIGDMSLVGPRPERRYFIDQIVETAPHYLHLLKVKPGITSWGQVKYGYAESVDQMVERLKYDILYIENMSLYVDFKIIIYTAITILKGRGI